MARVTLTPTQLVQNGGVADPAGTASVAGAGNGFTIASTYPVPQHYLWLRANNGTAGSGTISVLAGAQPLANASGQGPVTVTVAASGTQWVGPFDLSRVEQVDGSLTIETSVVMTVTAFIMDARRV